MRPITVVIAAALAGCATSPPIAGPASRGEVSYRSLDAPAQDRYRLADEEDFRVGAVRPDTRAVPDYPAAWLQRAPREVFVCTELHIDAQGAVFGARAVHASGCSGGDGAWDADFRAAVDAATRTWRFEPSYRCVLAPGATRGTHCEGARELEAVPVSRAFRFGFRRTADGGVVVGEDAAAGR